MSQQTQKNPHVPTEHDEPGAQPVPQPKAERISKDTAELLADIDDVLAEHDAAAAEDAAPSLDDLLDDIDQALAGIPLATVAAFRQRGGQ